MNKFQVILTLAMVAIASAEPPVLSGGYGYRRPISLGHGGGGGGGGGLIFGGGSNYISGGSSYISGGHGGFQSNEGQYVDPQLLHKIKEILLEQENLEQSNRNHHHGGGIGGGYISDSYGPPSSHYGVPYYNERVVGIDLGHVNPSIQVAHFHQQEHQSIPSGSYGVPHIPSGSYGVPTQTFVVPSIQIPSGSYGVPSDSYGAPHH